MSDTSISKQVAASAASLAVLSDLNRQQIGSVALFLRQPLKKDTYSGWRWLDVTDDLRLDVITSSLSFVHEASNKSVESLDFEVVTDDVIGVLSSEQFYQFSDGIEKLPLSLPAAAMLGNGKPHAEKAKAFAVVLTLKSGEEVKFFQSVGDAFVVSKKLLAYFEGSSNKLYKATDKVIQLPESFCMIEFDGSIFVLNEKKFSSLTSFDKYVSVAAETAFKTLTENPSIDIENLDEFKAELFKSSEFMRRLASADKVGALQNRDVKKMLDDVERYDLDVIGKMVGDKLVLTPNVKTRKGRRDIVDLLSDKITHSLSSGVGYRMQKGAPLTMRVVEEK